MVATSGAQLLPREAVRSLREELIPLTTILTPNIPEAKLLLQDAGQDVKDPENLKDIVELAKRVQALGAKYVLVKGGHVPLTKDGKNSKDNAEFHLVVDVLFDGKQATVMETDYLKSRNTHGTGCSLACKPPPAFDWLQR